MSKFMNVFFFLNCLIFEQDKVNQEQKLQLTECKLRASTPASYADQESCLPMVQGKHHVV